MLTKIDIYRDAACKANAGYLSMIITAILYDDGGIISYH